MSAEDLRERAAYRARRARRAGALHGAERFRDDFDMFEIQARYLRDRRASAASGCRSATRSSGRQLAAMREALAVRDEGTVPCNNDLLAENFILTGERFRLIDYEYSGNNDACFELGNVWSESNLSLAALEQLVGAYYGRPLRHKVARARLWGLMSKYGWTLWASIQDGVSEIDFDFWGWGWRSTSAPWPSSTAGSSSGCSKRSSDRTESLSAGRRPDVDRAIDANRSISASSSSSNSSRASAATLASSC